MEKFHKEAFKIFVAGTDTGVGKTVLSLLLMQFFFNSGYTPFYLKPLQTGCKDPSDTDSDACFIYQNVKSLNKKDPADSVTYCFKNPKAPYFAARNQREKIDPDVIQKAVDEKAISYNPLVIEAAGGLFVPVTEKMQIIDIIEIIGAKSIIAARAGLGTINHTLLTVEALRKREMQILGTVFIDQEDDVSPDMIRENIEAVDKFSETKVAGVVGKIRNFSNPEKKWYKPLEQMFSDTFTD
ncbi:MAG: dethiobiotin synthase [Deltaproteobacteria bacterium]|nr:MAG: dethiobiotin synthase [Deltaproteobacteria bacterium]